MKMEETFQLLTIMDLAKQWPELQALHDMARLELLELNRSAKDELVQRKEAQAAKEADEKAKANADAEAAKPRAIPQGSFNPSRVNVPQEGDHNTSSERRV